MIHIIGLALASLLVSILYVYIAILTGALVTRKYPGTTPYEEFWLGTWWPLTFPIIFIVVPLCKWIFQPALYLAAIVRNPISHGDDKKGNL